MRKRKKNMRENGKRVPNDDVEWMIKSLLGIYFISLYSFPTITAMHVSTRTDYSSDLK